MPQVKKAQPAPSPVSISIASPEPAAESETPKEKIERSPTWFWDKINDIPTDEWGKIYHLLLLRRGQSKVAMAPGEKGFLDQFMAPIDLVSIRQKYGGGYYTIVLNKNSHYVTSHDFEIEGNPNYDLRRERPATTPANGGGDLAQQVISVLREELQKSREANQSPNGVTDASIDMLTKASDKAMDVITSRLPQNPDASAQLTALVTAAEKIANLKTGSAFDLGQFLQNLLSNQVVAPLVQRLLSPPDPLAELAKLGAVLDTLEKIRGAGGPTHRGDWRSTLAEKAIEAVPQVLDTLKQNREASTKIAEENRATAVARQRTAETVAQIQKNPLPPPAPTPTPPPAANVPLRTVPLDTAPANGDAPTAIQTEDVVADWIKRRIVQGVLAGEEAEAIVDFLDVADSTVCDQLVAFPAEVVTDFLKNDPILAQAANSPNWPEFFEKARAYILAGAEVESRKPN